MLDVNYAPQGTVAQLTNATCDGCLFEEEVNCGYMIPPSRGGRPCIPLERPDRCRVIFVRRFDVQKVTKTDALAKR
jgi:hypothetical protein